MTWNGILHVNGHTVRYDYNNINNGVSPVFVYIEGTAYNVMDNRSILKNEYFQSQNIITFESGGSGWCVDSGNYRQKMPKWSNAVVSKVYDIYPLAKEFIIIGYSRGGYAIQPVYDACSKGKLFCVCMDGYPSFNTFDNAEKKTPFAYLLSNTYKSGHVTGRTKDHLKKLVTTNDIHEMKTKTYVNVFNVNHGELEYCIPLFNTIASITQYFISERNERL